MESNYYQVLGLPKLASTSEIKTRYKLLAKKYHPDLNGDVKAMMRLNQAYSVLIDPRSRFEYNRKLERQAAEKSVTASTPGFAKAATSAHTGSGYTAYSYGSSTSTNRRRAAQTMPRHGKAWTIFLHVFSPTGLAVIVLALFAGPILSHAVSSLFTADISGGSGLNTGQTASVAGQGSNQSSGFSSNAANSTNGVSSDHSTAPPVSPAPSTPNRGADDQASSCQTLSGSQFKTTANERQDLTQAEQQIRQDRAFSYSNKLAELEQQIRQYEADLSNGNNCQ